MIKTTLRIALTPAILIVRWVYPEFCVNVLRECKQQKLV